MEQMDYISFDDYLDRLIGLPGTDARDRFEREAEEAVAASRMGQVIKSERISHNLTRQQLGERAGVTPSQLSRIERGSSSVSLATVGRVFRALGVPPATIDLGASGHLALW